MELACPRLPEPRSIVRGVVLRPATAVEKPLWDTLMRQHHYLGFQAMIGESLRYVAEYQGQWLALLGWCSVALKCAVRDRWIGWTPALKLQRLPLVANNDITQNFFHRSLKLLAQHLPPSGSVCSAPRVPWLAGFGSVGQGKAGGWPVVRERVGEGG